MAKIRTIKELELLSTVEPNFGKGITVASGFDLGAKAPLDSRLTVNSISERNAHVTNNRAYEGMLVYVAEDRKTYQLIDNSWVEFGFNDDQFQSGIVDNLTSHETSKALSANQGRVLKGEIDAHIADEEKHLRDGERELILNAASREELAQAKSGLEGKIGAVEVKANANAGAIAAEVSRAQGQEAAIRREFAAADTALEQKINGVLETKANKTELNSAKGSIEEVRRAVEAEVSRAQGQEAAIRGEFAAADELLGQEIDEIRGIISGRSRTYVVQSHEEMEAIESPVEGDLALVVDERKSYVYDGSTWEIFDEVSSEVQLNKYLTIEEAGRTYRKLAEKIAQTDLTSELSTKIDLINTKANAADVYNKTQVDQKVSTVDGRVTTEISRVEGLIDAVDSKADGINGRLTAAEGKVTAVEGRLDTVEEGLECVDGKISTAVSALQTTLEDAISAVDVKVGVNTQAIAALRGRLDAVEPKVTAVEGRLSTAERKITANENAITVLQSELAATDRQVETNTSAIEELQAKAAKVEHVKKFKGNVAFTLDHEPVAGSVKFFVNGVKYAVNVAGSTVSWKVEHGFTLDAEDDIEVIYLA